MIYNRIQVAFGALRKINGPPLQWQYNEKQILVISGLDLPEYYAVDFMNEGDTDTITMTASASGVEIPDQFLLTGKKLIAYIVVVDGESVNTIGQITFPVNVRGRRTDISPEPAEQQQIDSLISAMNHTLEEAEDIKEEASGHAQDAEDSAILSESWAVGGTGTRQGEDTNNSEFWSRMAQEAASKDGWVYFYIDDEDVLHYVKTENSALSFYIDALGILHVTNA